MNRSVCTICADYLTCENSVACPCGHTFHIECISRWKEQSSTCPQCRERFKATIKLYFELSREDKAEGDPAELRNEVTELKLKIRVRDSSNETLKKQNDVLTQGNKSKDEDLKTSQQMLENALGTNDALKKQLTYVEKFKNDAKKAKNELLSLQKKVGSYRNIQELVNTESHDIEKTLKNFADNPDAFNQICTSYVVLKKEFERLKESKRTLENDKKSLRRKAEGYARESFDSKEQLKTVTNDLKHLDERNKSLTKKVVKLEESLASDSPQTSAIKRLLCESPAPMDLINKRQCVTDIQREQVADESLSLFSDGPIEDSGISESNTDDLTIDTYYANSTVSRKPLADVTKDMNNVLKKQNKKQKHHSNTNSKLLEFFDENSDLPDFKRGFNNNVMNRQSEDSGGSYESHPLDLDLDEEESLKIADEFGLQFGLQFVATTSATVERKPSNDSTKKNFKSSFVSKNVPSSHLKTLNENSDLPHFRRGFNGMGGQTKTLILPKKSGSLVKQPVLKKSFKIPKNNTKITKFTSEPKLPTINLSP